MAETARLYSAGDRPRVQSGRRHVFLLNVLARCYWSRPSCYQLEQVELVVELSRPLRSKLDILIFDASADDDLVHQLEATVDGKRLRVPWKVLVDEDDDQNEHFDFKADGDASWSNDQGRLFFRVTLGSLSCSSGRELSKTLAVVDKLHALLVDTEGQPLGPCNATVALPDGRERQQSIGSDGMLLIEHIAGGSCRIQLDLPDRAPIVVATSGHANDPHRIVRVPRLVPPPLPLPAGWFQHAKRETTTTTDPFTRSADDK